MIAAVFIERFLGSFVQILKDRYVLAVPFLPVLLFVYTLTFVVISAVVLIVGLIVAPISAVSRTKPFSFLGGN